MHSYTLFYTHATVNWGWRYMLVLNRGLKLQHRGNFVIRQNWPVGLHFSYRHWSTWWQSSTWDFEWTIINVRSNFMTIPVGFDRQTLLSGWTVNPCGRHAARTFEARVSLRKHLIPIWKTPGCSRQSAPSFVLTSSYQYYGSWIFLNGSSWASLHSSHCRPSSCSLWYLRTFCQLSLGLTQACGQVHLKA